jgi:hypothetical protein
MCPGIGELGIGVALQALLPLSSYGHYTCKLDIDGGAITDALGLRVIPKTARRS